MKETLANAQARERQARTHGRHIKLEAELNAIGLSLLAPPFTDFREVRGNEWEGHFVPESVFRPSQIQHHAFVIQELVRLVDELRVPYNNSARYHYLYAQACALLHKLDDWNLLPRLPQAAPAGWVEEVKESAKEV